MQLSLPAVFATLCLVVTPAFAQDGKTDTAPCDAGKNAQCQPATEKSHADMKSTAIHADAAKKPVAHKNMEHKTNLHEKKAHHTVAKSHSNKDVLSAQKYLTELGYKVGRADGVMGKRTMSAIGDYEKANHLPVTHHVSAKLLHSLEQSAHQKAKK